MKRLFHHIAVIVAISNTQSYGADSFVTEAARGVVLFGKSLVCESVREDDTIVKPMLPVSDFVQGIRNISIQNVLSTAKENPLDTAGFAAASLLGWGALPAGPDAIAQLTLATSGIVKNCKNLLQIPKLKIPTSSKYLIGLFSIAALVPSVQAFGNVQTVYITTKDLPSCHTPLGNYSHSCANTDVTNYTSTDPNVPASCRFTTECPSITAFQTVPNTVYFPTDKGAIPNVYNIDGTLNLCNTPPTTPCQQISGSYLQTCQNVVTQPYQSKDPLLSQVSLCHVTATCTSVDSQPVENDRIFYELKTDSGEDLFKLENCDGKLVQSSLDDTSCKTKDWSKFEFNLDDMVVPI